MWATIAGYIFKNPWIIALLVMTLTMGGMWVKITALRSDVVDLRSEIVRIETNYNTCKVNENGLLVSINEQNGSITSLNTIITGLQQQVIDEQEVTQKWERMYKNRPVVTTIKEVPVIEYIERGVVVDENTSKEYVRYFNTLFTD